MRRMRSVSIVPQNSDRPSTPHPSNPFRAVISLRLKVTKRFHYARGSSRAKPQLSATTIAKRKRSKYGHFRPPPLANELAMMQFADGGSLDSHIKRVMEAQAKAAGGSGGANVGVADVYRDEHGGIWWDEDEELEYAHLLDGLDRIKAEGDAEKALWEDFSRLSTHPGRPSSSANNSVDPSGSDRRLSSGSSVDSDLDPKFLLPPPESETYPTFTSGTPNDRVLASLRIGGEGMSSLSLPLRPSRQAPHLLQSISLEDVQAFVKNSEPYTSPRLLSSDGSVRRVKPKGAARRRPAPLKPALSSTHPNGPHHIGPAASPLGALHLEMVHLRKEFIDDSFTPPPSSSTTFFSTTSSSSPSSSMTRRNSRKSKSSVKKSSSSLSIRGLFARRTS